MSWLEWPCLFWFWFDFLTSVRYYNQLNNHRNFLIKISHKNLNIWWNFKMILQHLKMSLNISCNFKITWQHWFSSPCWPLGNWEEPWLMTYLFNLNIARKILTDISHNFKIKWQNLCSSLGWWLVGWFVVRMVCCLVDWLFDWLVAWLVGCFVRLFGCLVGWLDLTL